MAEPLRIDAGELTAEEILAAIREGRRVLVETTMLGGTHTVTLRHDGSIYYCDTPTTLHKHTSEEEMRACIDKMGYARGLDGDAGAGAEAGSGAE
jgi:hemin uptake protein HemP